MLEMQEKARKTEELLELMERERIEEEELFVVRNEELQNLRKQEVLSTYYSLLKFICIEWRVQAERTTFTIKSKIYKRPVNINIYFTLAVYFV